MKRLLPILFSLYFIFGLTQGSILANSPEKGEAVVGGNAPQFSIANLEGEDLRLTSLTGKYKVVVVNFWGLRCGACIEEMPHLNAISRKYGEEIVILGVNVDGMDGDYIRGQMSDMGLVMEYEVVPDPEFAMADMFQMMAAPLTIVIDSRRVIRYRHEDFVPGDEKKLEEAIRNIIDGKKVVHH